MRHSSTKSVTATARPNTPFRRTDTQTDRQTEPPLDRNFAQTSALRRMMLYDSAASPHVRHCAQPTRAPRQSKPEAKTSKSLPPLPSRQSESGRKSVPTGWASAPRSPARWIVRGTTHFIDVTFPPFPPPANSGTCRSPIVPYNSPAVSR